MEVQKREHRNPVKVSGRAAPGGGPLTVSRATTMEYRFYYVITQEFLDWTG